MNNGFIKNDKVIVILFATVLSMSYLIINNMSEVFESKKNTGKNVNDVPLSSIVDTSNGKNVYLGDFKDGVSYIGFNEEYDSNSGSRAVGYYIDKTGKIITDKLKTVNFSSSSEGLIAVINEKLKIGYMDNSGKMVIGYKYKLDKDIYGDFQRYDFSEGLAAVNVNDQWGYIDKTGKVVIDFNYNEVLPFSEGLAAVKKNGQWGYIIKLEKL